MIANRLNEDFCVGRTGTLKELKTRYFTLWYLTHVLPTSDEKRLPLSSHRGLRGPDLAQQLTNLRRQLMERLTQRIIYNYKKRGGDKIKKEDAEEAGLPGEHFDDIPVEEVQEKIAMMLNTTELDPITLATVKEKVDYAYRPIVQRRERVSRRREARRRRWASVGRFLNPFRSEILRTATLGPVKATKATFTGSFNGLKRLGKWLFTDQP